MPSKLHCPEGNTDVERDSESDSEGYSQGAERPIPEKDVDIWHRLLCPGVPGLDAVCVLCADQS